MLKNLRNLKLFHVGAVTTRNSSLAPKKTPTQRADTYVCALCLTLLACLLTLNSTAQETVVHFIDSNGETIAEVPAYQRAEHIYLPVDAVKQVFDPAATDQYNHPRKRLTLKTGGTQIRLQIGNPVVNVDPGGRTLTLPTPPLLIAQTPVLPISLFTELLPDLNNLEARYNSSLKRVQLTPKGRWTPAETEDSAPLAIIVDPGHGGTEDPGCEGRTGLLEKDVVLGLAKQLQQLSEARGMQVHLTRQTDTQITRFERIQIAKRNQGQLLLSLHCNASFSPHEKGIKVYLNNPKGRLRFSSSTEAAAMGQQLKPIAQANFLKQSQGFAHALQTELNFLTETPVEIIELPLVTLSDVYMPGVVLEIGYLSHAGDLEKLSNPAYIADIAQAVVRAFQRYLSSPAGQR